MGGGFRLEYGTAGGTDNEKQAVRPTGTMFQPATTLHLIFGPPAPLYTRPWRGRHKSRGGDGPRDGGKLI